MWSQYFWENGHSLLLSWTDFCEVTIATTAAPMVRSQWAGVKVLQQQSLAEHGWIFGCYKRKTWCEQL